MTERMGNDPVLGAQRAPAMSSGSAPQVPRGRGSAGHVVNQMPAPPPNGFPFFFCFSLFFWFSLSKICSSSEPTRGICRGEVAWLGTRVALLAAARPFLFVF